ncbi:MAG: YiiD C-terminal domain-containing protein [Candidatus Obscuribacterales bacterium]|nr:YiiD C-terminal domain-containing protein [Candidatus Obscuribacterales bacterium]
MSEQVKKLVEAIPFNAELGIQVISFESGRAKCKLPFKESLANHVGTMHAAAQFAVIEAASGVALMAALADLLDQCTPLALGADIAYRAPAHGDCTADASVSTEDVKATRDALFTQDKAKVAVQVTLADSNGTISTECTVRWHIRMNDTKK